MTCQVKSVEQSARPCGPYGPTDKTDALLAAAGIAEALIATAIGLFAAIPAVIAYNRFSDKVDRIAVRYENFREEFTTLLERQTHLSKDKA